MKQITAVVVGFGDRSEIYSKFSLHEPEMLKIVAVVDPDKVRRDYAAQLFNLPADRCFASIDGLLALGKIADCLINGTMDSLHVSTTLPFLKLGYDVLLEKPITSDKAELIQLLDTAKKYNNRVVVCHVLRYTPFYLKIKNVVDSGEIGEIRHMETSENVGVAHASVSYIRGKWNNKRECGSSYLLAKCCHDLDLLCWLNSKSTPKIVSSIGGKDFFISSKAPKDSGTRCLVDCPQSVEQACPYSARKIYLQNNPIPSITWKSLNKLAQDVTMEERENSLKTDNPHGRCIFKTDADIVDQQMTMVKFEDGSTAYHGLFSSTARAGRRIMIYGSKGEIEGFTEDKAFVVRQYNPENILYTERKVLITEVTDDDGHHGGDSRIMYDLIKVLNGEKPSVSTSNLDASIISHLCVYAADESMESGKIISVQNI